MLSEALTAGPQLGITGALVIVIGYFMRSNRHDRREAVAAMTARDAAHAGQVAALRIELDELKAEVRELRRDLEKARRARWRAEDEAAKYRRRLGLPDLPDPEETPGA